MLLFLISDVILQHLSKYFEKPKSWPILTLRISHDVVVDISLKMGNIKFENTDIYEREKRFNRYFQFIPIYTQQPEKK